MRAGRMPRRTSVRPKRASSAATAMSPAQVRPTPPPNTFPCARTTTGLGKSATEENMPARVSASRRFCSKLARPEAFICSMSTPAQNEAPRPPRTTTGTPGSWARSWKVAVTARTSSASSALCCWGRSSHTWAVTPLRSTSITWVAMRDTLHPEDAEAHVGYRSVERRRQRQGEDVPRLRGIDDAIVPQARGGVVGIALGFVFLERGALELALLLRAPALALGFELRALDRGQHARGLLAAHHADARVGPHEEEARLVGAAAHAVVPGAERT